MFKSINDVPAQIKEFYRLDPRSEQKINTDGEAVFKDEEYRYQNENGDWQTGTKKVPVFVDVDYVVLISRPEEKNFDDVMRIAEGQKPQNVLDMFIGMYSGSIQWKFHDEYITWLEKCKAIEEQAREVERTQSDDGRFIPDDPLTDNNEAWAGGLSPDDIRATKPDEPTKPDVITIEQFKLDNYRELRRFYYGDWHSQLEMQYDGLWDQHVKKIKEMFPAQ